MSPTLRRLIFDFHGMAEVTYSYRLGSRSARNSFGRDSSHEFTVETSGEERIERVQLFDGHSFTAA